MNNHEPLDRGNYYHIFNRGNNRCNLFREPENYEYFLSLYYKHISPIAETYAWVLMPNHFHFLVKIRETEDTFTGKGSKKAFDPYKSPFQYFSDLFNAYTKSVNKWYNRTGSLFEHPFRRKKITDLDYFRQLVLYIHNNPVHHGFTEKAMDYPWSSYLTLLSVARTNLERDKVMGWFDSEANFRLQHQSVEKEIPKDWSVFESKP